MDDLRCKSHVNGWKVLVCPECTAEKISAAINVASATARREALEECEAIASAMSKERKQVDDNDNEERAYWQGRRLAANSLVVRFRALIEPEDPMSGTAIDAACVECACDLSRERDRLRADLDTARRQRGYACAQLSDAEFQVDRLRAELDRVMLESAECQEAMTTGEVDLLARLRHKDAELAEARKNGERMLGYLKRMFPYTTTRLEDDVLGYFGEKSIDFVAAMAEGGENG